ncbi:MAG: FkbM family methyltransferase [Acidobacteriota bacterium]|jgi:FkbM family methyltransferase|nr:FkbM family methyltransferase [Bryobacteraceae bacterium CoA2 C42]MCA2966726.1 FkbM family methyltransferase [Acidobacteriaceae bacterium]
MMESIAQEATARAWAALGETAREAGMTAFFDELWGWRIGAYRIPDPELAQKMDRDWGKWAGIVAKYRRDVNDYWFHVYKPQAGDGIVDIGAGRGEDVLVFSEAVGPEGHVWALEPHPVSFLALRKLCEWNGLRNVTVRQVACIERTETLQIETMPVWESNYVRSGAPSATSATVEGRPFDALSREMGIGPISFLKLNIEGAERQALPGCREVLGRTRSVCVAAHDFRADRGEAETFRTLGFVKSFLHEAGFALTTRDEDKRYYVPYHVHGVRS